MTKKTGVLRRSDVRPGMRVRNWKTGQVGAIARTRWGNVHEVPVDLQREGQNTGRRVFWKIREIELV